MDPNEFICSTCHNKKDKLMFIENNKSFKTCNTCRNLRKNIKQPKNRTVSCQYSEVKKNDMNCQWSDSICLKKDEMCQNTEFEKIDFENQYSEMVSNMDAICQYSEVDNKTDTLSDVLKKIDNDSDLLSETTFKDYIENINKMAKMKEIFKKKDHPSNNNCYVLIPIAVLLTLLFK